MPERLFLRQRFKHHGHRVGTGVPYCRAGYRCSGTMRVLHLLYWREAYDPRPPAPPESGLQIFRFGQQRRQRRLQGVNHGSVAFAHRRKTSSAPDRPFSASATLAPLFQLLPGGGKENRHQHAAGTAHHNRQTLANQGEQRGEVSQRQLTALK